MARELVTTFLLTAFVILLISRESIAAKKPHILFVLADDYGWNDVGYHGSDIKTPTLDRLSAEGVRLENYYVQPICTPSRSQLLTGRYQIHTGLQHSIIWYNQANGLPLQFPTIATHIVGKWHLGFYKKEYMPTNRGFDTHYGYLTGAEYYFTHKRCYETCGIDLRDNLDVDKNQNGVYSTHLFTKRAEDIIANHDKNKPLFLYLPYQAVHSPLEVPEEYVKPYQRIKNKARRTYAGMVSAMDEGVANVTKALKQHRLWEDTIMVFSTDNGGQILSGGNNWPLRGWKGSLWEGGFRGVGFVHSNSLETKGKINRELIHISDWFPTLLSLAGGSPSNITGLDGYNVWDTISKNAPSPRTELLHNIDPLFTKSGTPAYSGTFDTSTRAAFRMGKWKIITGNPGNGSWIKPAQVIDSGEHHVENTFEDTNKNVWLFDILDDPTERNDLSQKYPNIVKKMLTRLQAYNATAVPAIYPPPDPRADPSHNGGVWGPWE
ncbi:arylsulfatase B-like [Lingula anatina]|uniref:Arylsulfatase B-like n=1 Tax=Lingula anatina TaxID=7574 RepID=A0A1S3H875_LINAN|nr:arylsulfatase B-like [Lingula anatina]|eukprot:XP_013382182.1 arylsulfatase B-like [Lingula anatina]